MKTRRRRADARGGRPAVLLGITGSIAAYKGVQIASRLAQAGIDVFTVMTESARRFVAPLTFQSVTGLPVATDLFGVEKHSRIEHVDLARRANLVLIAPATANTIARLAQGRADEVLSATVLASTAPVLIAPAMNPGMWASRATQENVERLRSRGCAFIGPATGRAACGDEGQGRMADPGEIVSAARSWLERSTSLRGKKVLVTAGPTREYLDAVRFISNRSSGKMGYAVAEAARRRGAEVTLISGPAQVSPPFGVRVIPAETGEDMRREVLGNFDRCDVLVMTAAVTDYRPDSPRAGKTSEGRWNIRLRKVGNILRELSGRKRGRVVVGFAAEIGAPVAGAVRKLKSRGLDLVVANDVSAADSGFASDSNRAVMVRPGGKCETLPLMPKRELAGVILDAVEGVLRKGPRRSAVRGRGK